MHQLVWSFVMTSVNEAFIDEDQARPDPGESGVDLVGPNPELTNEEFMENVYPNFHESLKFSADEHVILEDPLSSNLDDAFTIGDQFINDKATEDDQEKVSVESEVVSMVIDKSRKRRCDDQDPPPPPPDSDPSKKRRHDSGTSGSSQPPAPQSSAWKLTDTRDAPSSSSKQQSSPHSEQPVEDILMPETANISDSEDTDSEDTSFAHLPKIKPMPEWLKPIPEEDRPATPEPAYVIPTSHTPDATGDMRTFMNWYCQKMGKTELTQADLEGRAYEVVKAFYPDVVHLQFQMEECHKMLTDQID
ncbi:hypothetical protein Tco_0331082 [Tanacetum coccineum]